MARNNGRFTQPFLPRVNHGPVSVQVNNEYKLLELAHIADLLMELSPTELALFESELQSVINKFCEMKNIPHN